MKPDIVQRINEHLRLKKENERREKEKLREEMKLNQYSGGGDWYWESEKNLMTKISVVIAF